MFKELRQTSDCPPKAFREITNDFLFIVLHTLSFAGHMGLSSIMSHGQLEFQEMVQRDNSVGKDSFHQARRTDCWDPHSRR